MYLTMMAGLVCTAFIAASVIDRRAVVARHSPRFQCLTASSCAADFQTLGNGGFAFTADVTGLQTFNTSAPLNTLSNWGWHTTPIPKSVTPSATPQDFQYQQVEAHGKSSGYPTGCVTGETPCEWKTDTRQAATTAWLRANPHRLNLGRLYLRPAPGSGCALSGLSAFEQSLDLWAGMLQSRFVMCGEAVEVITVVHPETDVVAVRVRSKHVASGVFTLGLDFPYGVPTPGAPRMCVPTLTHAPRDLRRRGYLHQWRLVGSGRRPLHRSLGSAVHAKRREGEPAALT